MTKNLKLSLSLLLAFAVVAVGLLLINRATTPDDQVATAAAGGTAVAMSEETHTLSLAPDGKVVLVEFLDFECEACLALYPTMERIKAEYEDQITFGVRYFPIPSHPNAELAATAVEAAARQDQFEAMYQKMYETQEAWSHTETSQEQLFVGFAEDLGLDVEQFRTDLADPAVAQRVARDQDAGLDLGVQGTPTLFLNGQMLPSMPSYEVLKDSIDAALAQ